MTELTLLKKEARELLDEVNRHFETSPNGKRIITSPWHAGNIYEEISFKEKVQSLRKKFRDLSTQNAAK